MPCANLDIMQEGRGDVGIGPAEPDADVSDDPAATGQRGDAHEPNHQRLGVLAACGAILAFSIGSTFVKLAQEPGQGITTPGATIAFWRMVLCSGIWILILRISERRWLHWDDVRAALVPGVLFGLNIMVFFTGVTRTSVPHAEFIGTMTPFLLVPVGIVLFNEQFRPLVALCALVSVGGLALVLFGGAASSGATLTGDLIVVAAVCCWAAYLTASRQVRRGRSVSAIMAGMMPTATLVTLPLPLLRGDLTTVTDRAIPFILLLAVSTGTAAHGLVVYAQQHLAMSKFTLMQVVQPAIATLWAVLLLNASLSGWQVIGMAIVLAGQVAMTVAGRRPVGQNE
jgi:inner membrane transporter RhtA